MSRYSDWVEKNPDKRIGNATTRAAMVNRTPEIEAVLMHGRDYLALMTPDNRALLVEALDNLEAVTR